MDKYENEWNNLIIENLKKNIMSVRLVEFVESDIFTWDMIDMIPTEPDDNIFNDEYVNRIWNALSTKATVEILDKYIDKPWDWSIIDNKIIKAGRFFYKYPNFNYDFNELSWIIPVCDALKHKDKGWYWGKYSSEINANHFINNLELEWDFEDFYFFVSKKQLKKLVDIGAFSRLLTRTVPTNLVIRNPELDWDYDELICRGDMPLRFINDNEGFRTIVEMDSFTKSQVGKFKNIGKAMNVLRKYPKINWDWKVIKNKYGKCKTNILKRSDLHCGWNISKMVIVEFIELDHIRDTCQMYYYKLIETNEVIGDMVIDICDILENDWETLINMNINEAKKRFIEKRIHDDNLAEHKLKMFDVLEELIGEHYEYKNINKLINNGCFFSMVIHSKDLIKQNDLYICSHCGKYVDEENIISCFRCGSLVVHYNCPEIKRNTNNTLICDECKTQND